MAWISSYKTNKKVLLHERKRHTARKRAQDAEDAEKMCNFSSF